MRDWARTAEHNSEHSRPKSLLSLLADGSQPPAAEGTRRFWGRERIPRKQELFVYKNGMREANLCTLCDEPVVHRVAASGLINSCHAVHYRTLTRRMMLLTHWGIRPIRLQEQEKLRTLMVLVRTLPAPLAQ